MDNIHDNRPFYNAIRDQLWATDRLTIESRRVLLDVVDDMVQKYERVKCANEVLRTKVEMLIAMVGLNTTQAAWGGKGQVQKVGKSQGDAALGDIMREEERQAKAKPKPKARPPPRRDEGKVLVFTKEGSESAAETKAALLSDIVKTGDE